MRAVELFDVSRQVAIVTGAAGGIGFEIVRVLAHNGACVYLADIDAKGLDTALARLGDEAGECIGVQADVTDETALARLFDQVEAEKGGATLLVNNAGIIHRNKAARLDREIFDKVLTTNVEAAFLAARLFADRGIAAGRQGAIINVTSILAEVPVKQVLAYCASKAALSQMTRGMALEWGQHGIRVNEIRPGWFDTSLTEDFLKSPGRELLARQNPLGRLGHHGDLDGAVLFLASQASAYVTGAAITVDGGHTIAR